MAVVVDDGDAVVFAECVHASVESVEGGECFADAVPGGAESVCGDGGDGAVVGHVHTGET